MLCVVLKDPATSVTVTDVDCEVGGCEFRPVIRVAGACGTAVVLSLRRAMRGFRNWVKGEEKEKKVSYGVLICTRC